MDQPFESDVMDDLESESSMFAYEPDLDENDGFDEEGEYEDAGDFEDLEDFSEREDPWAEDFAGSLDERFANERGKKFATLSDRKHTPDSLEIAVAEALESGNRAQFLRQLVQGMRRIAILTDRTQAAQAVRNGKFHHHNEHSSTQRPKFNGSGTLASANSMQTTSERGRKSATIIAPMARILNQLLSQTLNERQTLNQFLDWVESVDTADVAAPVIAGLTIRTTIPEVEQFPRRVRMQLVQSVSQSTRDLAKQGTPAVRAIVPILESVTRTAQRHHIPDGELGAAVRRTTRQVAANTELVHRLIYPNQTAAFQPNSQKSFTVQRSSTESGMQRLIINVPVEIIIRSL
jgi:hypothetical protein